jgi:hypothetical protein
MRSEVMQSIPRSIAEMSNLLWLRVVLWEVERAFTKADGTLDWAKMQKLGPLVADIRVRRIRSARTGRFISLKVVKEEERER